MSGPRPPLRHLQGALGWFLAAQLLTYALINLIGFISPFWGAWQYPGDLHASKRLLHAWQPILPWFSLCFLVAGWHLAMTMRSLPARVVVVAAYVLVPVAMIGSSIAHRMIQEAGTSVPPQGAMIFSMLADAYLGFMVIVFFALVWWTLRRSNRSPLAEGVPG